MAEEILVPETLLTPQLAQPVAGALAPSPYSFEFTAASALRLTVHNSQSGVTVAVHYRMLDPSRRILTNRYELVPTADRAPATGEFVIGEGYLLNLTIFASSGTPRRGQTYVRLQAIHGRSTSATVIGTLVQGYVTAQQDRAWPGSPLETSIEGIALTRTVVGTQPAALADIAETVPTGARWRVRGFTAFYQCGALAGNRVPNARLHTTGGANIYSYSPVTLIAGESTTLAYALGMPLDKDIAGFKVTTAGLPDIVLLAGDTVNASMAGRVGTDQWGVPFLLVDEWLEAN